MSPVAFVFLAAFIALARTGRPLDGMDHDISILKKCNATSPVDKDFMNRVLISKIVTDKNNYGFKCFLHCLYEEYGWMDHHGMFHLHTIKKFLRDARMPVKTVRKLLQICTDSESKDKCERAFEYTQCFWGEMGKPEAMDPEEDFMLLEDFGPYERRREEYE